MKSLFFSTIVVLLLAEFQLPANAQTGAELQASIDAIKAQIARLSVSPTVSDIPLTFRFTRTLNLGNRGTDVRFLQILLNRDPLTAVGVKGDETNYFGAKTKAAVIKFQNRYASEVLLPSFLSVGTGRVGELTRAKLNVMLATLTPVPAPLIQSLPPISVITPLPIPAPTPLSFDEVNRKTRDALVNIICTTLRSGSFNPLSGSGVIIDPRGVILTSAHVAQYYLLKDYAVPDFVSCTVRTGAPATNRYRAKLLYIPPQWVEANAAKIQDESPTGSGKHDYALLLITESVNPETLPLPATFPSLPPLNASDAVQKGQQVLVAGYAAGFLSGIAIQRDLYPLSSQGTVTDVYSFDGTSRDVVGVAGSPLAQHGASGGGAVDESGRLLGIVATASDGKTTGERNVNIVTFAHINKSFMEQNSQSMFSFLAAGNFAQFAENFNTGTVPALSKLLIDEVNRNNQ
ncbi:MAG: trypsin-like peptidase domain-containing protein [bacterium]|nr:trypsin-like peptidase domain-containing protein [bacterium]